MKTLLGKQAVRMSYTLKGRVSIRLSLSTLSVNSIKDINSITSLLLKLLTVSDSYNIHNYISLMQILTHITIEAVTIVIHIFPSSKKLYYYNIDCTHL